MFYSPDISKILSFQHGISVKLSMKYFALKNVIKVRNVIYIYSASQCRQVTFLCPSDARWSDHFIGWCTSKIRLIVA